MDAQELFIRCLDQASKTFHKLKPENYSKPTPDTEWNVEVLANHMLYELSWIPDLLAGKTIMDVGDKYDGNLLGDDPAASWDKAAALAKGEAKLAQPRAMAHLSYGSIPNEDYLCEVGGDLFIHGWDLAAALGVERTLDPAAAEAVYKHILPVAPSLAESGLYKPALDTPAYADSQTKLLALTGRDVDWQP